MPSTTCVLYRMQPNQWLEQAAAEGDAEGVVQALARGAAVNATTDPMGMTGLHKAARNGHPCCLELLLGAGADVRAVTYHGMTPLHMAALGNTTAHAACVAALLQHGAEPAAKSASLQTPLHCAAQKGAVWALQKLLTAAGSAGAVQAIDRFNRTPLDEALVSAFCEPPGRWTQHCTACAFCLLMHGPLHPPRLGSVLTYLGSKDRWARVLYAPLLLRNPLTPEQWELVPFRLPGLGSALPAVMQRSKAEAEQLLRRMPAADLHHLRTIALSLGAAEHRSLQPCLPTDIKRGLLLQCAEQHGKAQLCRFMTVIYHLEKQQHA